MTALTTFLLARIAEDEEAAKYAEASWTSVPSTQRVLAECEAKRRIIALHQDWPVLVEGPETSELVDGGLDSIAYRVTRQMAWLTTREYVARFGIEPPTTPVLRALALPYADHQDFDPAWAAPV